MYEASHPLDAKAQADAERAQAEAEVSAYLEKLPLSRHVSANESMNESDA